MKVKFGLLPRIVLAITLGVLLGGYVPGVVVRAFNTFSGLFDQFIRFMVPLIIIGLVVPAIADTGRKAGKMLLVTVALAYVSTLVAGLFSYGVSVNVFPSLVERGSATAVNAVGAEFPAFVKVAIPAMVDVMSALVFAFIMGLGIVFSESTVLKSAADEMRRIINGTIAKVIVPVLPVYIFSIFLDMTAAGKVKVVLTAFAAIVVVEALLTLVMILIQYTIAGSIAGVNPLKALWKMAPAYFTALGTSSSAATIPVTRNQAVAAGVRPEVADFTVPLCATVHLAGSTIKLVACAVALILIGGDMTKLDLATFMQFIALLGMMMVAAPGVPGGAVMASLGVAESLLGFGKEQIALFITLYIATDSFGTACNVIGDGALSLIVNRIFPESKKIKDK
jgi:Na+/H+-dicarboxylate symporter